MTRNGLLGVLLLAVSSSAGAQVSALTEQQRQSVETELARGQTTLALQLLSRDCERYAASSRDRSRSAGERAVSARERLQCVRLVSAEIVAMAPLERSFQIRAVLDANMERAALESKVADAENEFLGLRWGVGLGVSLSREAIVDGAEIVNDTVRVTSERQQLPRVLFEYHKLFWRSTGKGGQVRGFGPFVVAAASSEKVLSGVGAGLIAGQKLTAEESDGFAIGVGGVLDGAVSSLGEGFRANEPVPAGATTVRYTSKSRWSWLVFVTRTF